MPEMTAADRLQLTLFALLAVAGFVWPWSYNLAHSAAHGGFSVSVFVAEAFSTYAGASLSADVVVGGTAWLVWMWPEARRLGMRPWGYLAATMLVAFAFAAPLFFFRRKWILLYEAQADTGSVA
jgi:hypothetical protein